MTRTAPGPSFEVVERITEAVATRSARPRDYVLIPFNEPDGGNWYPEWPEHREQFLADWLAVVGVIRGVWARHGLGEPRIGGPGDMQWQPERTADFLEFAAVHHCLPQVFIWHELGIDNLGTYRGHLREFRAMEAERGIAPMEVNITEYAMLRDMAVPGQLIQWLAMFEDTKVDAQMAYWNYAGNLSDNSARANGANGGWWMLTWYGDLEGSTTVSVTPPHPDVPDTLQAIAAVDAGNARATVLCGGGDGEFVLELTGLDPAVFGTLVDVAVREATLTGVDGLHPAPRVVSSLRGELVGEGGLSLTVAAYDRHCAYQVLITPAAPADAPAPSPWWVTVEAEDTALTDAAITRYDPPGGRGVAVPRLWRRGRVVVPLAPGLRHVDGGCAPRRDVPVPGHRQRRRRAGTPRAVRRRRVRGLRRPSGEPGAQRAVPREVPRERGDDGAARGRAAGAVAADQPRRGLAAPGGRGDAGPVRAHGRHRRRSHRPPRRHLPAVRRRPPGLDDGGRGRGPALRGRTGRRLRLRLGVGLSRPGGADGRRRRARGLAPGQRPGRRKRRCRGGGASRRRPGVPGPGHQRDRAELPWRDRPGAVAGGDARRRRRRGAGALVRGATLPRDGALAAAGEFVVVVTYANAELQGSHDYNPQVVDRRLEVWEGASQAGDAHVRYTYSWDNFWERAIPVTLTTADQPLRLLNPTGEPPLIREVRVARLRHPTH